MEELSYSLPGKFISDYPELVSELKRKKKAILEQLPKRARQKVTRHHALGQLTLKQIPELGITLVQDKAHNALLSAVGLDVRYATVAELLSCTSDVSIVADDSVA